MTELVGAVVQFSVRELLVFKNEGNGIGCPFRLALQTVREGIYPKHIPFGVIPILE
jgi:hypothetical protein